MSKKIDLKLLIIQQKYNDHTCGPACLAMIYQFFGKKISQRKILKDLEIGTKEGTYTFQLGRHLLQSGLTVRAVVSHPGVLDPTWSKLSREKMIGRLKLWIPFNLDHYWAKSSLYYLFYLQEGGEIEIKNITKEMVDAGLEKGMLILAAVDQSWLWGKRKLSEKVQYDDLHGKTTGHYVIICGRDDKNYKVVDPYPTKIRNREKRYWMDKDTVINSIMIWSHEILMINDK